MIAVVVVSLTDVLVGSLVGAILFVDPVSTHVRIEAAKTTPAILSTL